MNRRVLASYNIGDSVWFVHDNKCEFASIKEVLKKDNYIIITTDMNTHTVNNKELYEYRSRIDLEFKRLEEVNEFVNRRFYDCKESFKDNSYYFVKLLCIRFPDLEIIYIKNKDYFICSSGYLCYDVYGLYEVDKSDECVDFRHEYVNNTDFREFINNTQVL